MTSMARTFGAPVTLPLGNIASSSSVRVTSERSSAVTTATRWCTLPNVSTRGAPRTRTLPARAIRPRSLRSTSMTIASTARSLGSRENSRVGARSDDEDNVNDPDDRAEAQPERGHELGDGTRRGRSGEGGPLEPPARLGRQGPDPARDRREGPGTRVDPERWLGVQLGRGIDGPA